MKPYRATEEDSHFVIDHGDGRPYKVAKAGLSAAMHQKIRHFSDGGAVTNDRKYRMADLLSGNEEGTTQAPAKAPPHTDWWAALKQSISPTKKPVKMADGGKAEEKDEEPAVNKAYKSAADALWSGLKGAGNQFMQATYAPIDAFSGVMQQAKEDMSPQPEFPQTGQNPPPAPEMPAEEEQKPSMGPEAPEGSVQTPSGTITPDAVNDWLNKLGGAGNPTGGGAGRDVLSQINKREQGALQHQADVARGEYDQLDKLQKAHIIANENEEKQFLQERSARLQAQKQMRDKIAAGQIDPNHWLNSQDTGGKISAAIGIMLGGIGGGITGKGGNVAMDIIQKHIDRDIEAQKANLGKQQSDYSNLLQEGYDADNAYKILRSNRMADVAAKAQGIAYASGKDKVIADTEMKRAQVEKENYMTHLEAAAKGLQMRKERLGIDVTQEGLEWQKKKRQVSEYALRTGQIPPGGELFLDKEVLAQLKAQKPDAKTLEAMEAYRTATDKSPLAKTIGAIPGMSHLPDVLPSSRAASASDNQILEGLMSMKGITRPNHPAVKGWEKMLEDRHSVNPEVARDANKRLAQIMTAHAEARRLGATPSAQPVDTGGGGGE